MFQCLMASLTTPLQLGLNLGGGSNDSGEPPEQRVPPEG